MNNTIQRILVPTILVVLTWPVTGRTESLGPAATLTVCSGQNLIPIRIVDSQGAARTPDLRIIQPEDLPNWLEIQLHGDKILLEVAPNHEGDQAAFRLAIGGQRGETWESEIAVRVEGVEGVEHRSNLSVFPNPFNSTVAIEYSGTILSGQATRVTIWNCAGQMIRELVPSVVERNGSEVLSAQWSATNDSQQGVASGVYHVVVNSGRSRQSTRVLLLR